MTTPERDELDLIAAEYALGTLAPGDARDFEQRLASDVAARERLAYWEDRLGRLGLDLEPVEPPAHVWTGIARRTGRPAANEAVPDTGRSTRRWRRLAIAASIAAVVLAGLSAYEFAAWRGGGEPTPHYASVIYDKPTGMSWLVTSIDDGRELSVRAMGDFSVPSGKMLRMWIKSPDGQPRLVGRLPHKHGHYTMALTDKLRAELGDHSELVVSMEDVSRAGTTTPSGKIMWVSPLAHRTG